MMREFDFWLHYIPSFFCVLAFVSTYLLNVIEMRIEKRDIERRMKRDKASATLKRYFKKKEDRFDKVEYLGDMYKLMQANVDNIKKQIEENQRKTDEENHDNMNQMIMNKYSVTNDLQKAGSDKDLVII